MNINDLVAANTKAHDYGVKALIYGSPGSGKTPLVKTAPGPVVLATEPGLMSIRDWDGPVFEAHTASRIEEFFAWVRGSNEAAQFHTVCVDSVSRMSEIYLADEKAGKKHSNRWELYGAMSERVLPHLDMLYELPYKHVYLIAHQGSVERNSVQKAVPAFEGNKIGRSIAHKYDLVGNIGAFNIPGHGITSAICTKDSLTITARDRSGMLNEFEPPDLTHIINKCMSAASNYHGQ